MRRFRNFSSRPSPSLTTAPASAWTAGAPALAVLLAAYVICAVVATMAGARDSWAEYDQRNHHLPEINEFLKNGLALFHYRPTHPAFPGFHLLIAALAELFGMNQVTSDTWLRIVPFLMGLGTLCILWRLFVGFCGDPWRASLLCLPLLTARYFILASVYLDTENAAYLGYALLLAAYIRCPERGVTIGLIAAATVFTRQLYLGVIGTQIFALWAKLRQRNTRDAALLALLPGLLIPLALFGAYLAVWHAPVPPEFRENEPPAFPNPYPLLESIGVLGIFALPYAALVPSEIKRLGARPIVRALTAGALFGSALWLALPTTRDVDTGRLGSIIWMLMRLSPALGQHVLLVLPCLMLGIAALWVLLIEHPRTQHYRPIEGVMFALYIATLVGQFFAFQRYNEVPTLVTLSTYAARAGRVSKSGVAVFAVAWLAALAPTLLLWE